MQKIGKLIKVSDKQEQDFKGYRRVLQEFEEFKKNVREGKEVLYIGCYMHEEKPNPNCDACLELNYAKLYCNTCKSHQRIKSFKALPTHIEYVCIKGHLNKRKGDKFLH
jgi:hypothetical protein